MAGGPVTFGCADDGFAGGFAEFGVGFAAAPGVVLTAESALAFSVLPRGAESPEPAFWTTTFNASPLVAGCSTIDTPFVPLAPATLLPADGAAPFVVFGKVPAVPATAGALAAPFP